jgi:hypothetical protein
MAHPEDLEGVRLRLLAVEVSEQLFGERLKKLGSELDLLLIQADGPRLLAIRGKRLDLCDGLLAPGHSEVGSGLGSPISRIACT